MKKISSKIFTATLCTIAILLPVSLSHAVISEFDDIALDGVNGSNPFIRFDESTGQYYIVGFGNRMSFYDTNSYSFNIYRGAPSNTLNLNTNGVGVGIIDPKVPLHVVKSDGNAQIRVVEQQATTAVKTLFNLVCDQCTPGFRFNQVMPNNQTWFFRMLQNGNFSVDDPLTPAKEAEFRSGGNLVIGGLLTESSSRTVKKNITEVNNVEILDKLDTLPVSQWTYRHENDHVKHIGPMAEDFYKAFKLGDTAKGIASLDSAGVALAAIKGLHQRLKQKTDRLEIVETELEHKQAQTHALAARLDELEKTLAEVSATNAVLVELMEQTKNDI